MKIAVFNEPILIKDYIEPFMLPVIAEPNSPVFIPKKRNWKNNKRNNLKKRKK